MAKITSRNMQPEQEQPAPAPKSDPSEARDKLEQALTMIDGTSELARTLREAIDLL